MRMLSVMFVIMFITAAPGFAQDVSIPASVTPTIGWDYPAIPADTVPPATFQVLVDGAPAGSPVMYVVGAASYTTQIPAFTVGDHVMIVRAVNAYGSADSDVLTIHTKKPTPPKPGTPRIVEVTIGSTGTTIKVQPTP